MSEIECDVTKLALEDAKPYAAVVPYATFELLVSSVVQVIKAVVCPGVPEEIAEETGAVLSSVTVIDEEVAKLLEVSRATANIVFEPDEVAVESHVIEYGELVSSLR